MAQTFWDFVFHFLLLIVTTAQLNQSLADKNEALPGLINLGIVDGKRFYFQETFMNWTDAKTYCNSSGLRLAEVNSPAQQEFLKTKHSMLQPPQPYWMAGIDSQQSTQMVWERTKEQLPDLHQKWRFSIPYSCLTWATWPENHPDNGIWESKLCSVEWRPLCESKCNSTHFTCENGECIKLSSLCNQANDCTDASDENEIVCSHLSQCKEDEYFCELESKCIPLENVDDGIVDCAGGEDERNQNTPADKDNIISVIIATTSAVVFMVVAAGCFLCRRRSEKPALKRHETSTEIRKSFHTGNTDTAQNTEILPTPWKTDNSLKCISILGEGTFGKVFKAVNPQNLDNPFVAIKCVDIRKMLKLSCTPGCTTSTTTESNHTSKNVDTNILTTLLNEIDVLSQLSNDHVVRYIDSWAEAEDFSCHKLDRFKLQEYVKSLLTSSLSLPCCILSPYNNIFIRMELCQFTLKYFLVKIDPQNLGIRHVATIFNDVATGLKYIHQKGFIHRDIKPGNLFCKQEQGEGYIWKIGDFGLATRLAEHPDKNYGQLGTKWYWSPEMSRNYSYTTKTDMYSLGLTFLEIVKHGRDEFEMFKLAEKLNVLRSVERSVYLREAVQDKFAPWQKVIAKLVEPEQSKRFDCNKLEVILCNISY